MSDRIEVPQPVTWAVNIAAQETQRAAKIRADIADMDKRIIATQTLLDQLVAAKDAAGGDHARCVANAGLAREMAERACADHGWTMPEIPAEPPLNETQSFPAVCPDCGGQRYTEDGVLLHVVSGREDCAAQACPVCGDPIALPPGGTWLHINGKPACDLVHGEGTATAPPAAATDPADETPKDA